jgi:NADH-ubiquinone oxidoreductase chain 2
MIMGSINPWIDTIMVVATLSLITGAVLGLAQTRIKRLLTYSTISHVGFMLLALAAFSADAVASFFFYLAQYSITSLASLIILLAFGYVVRGHSFSGSQRAHMFDIELISEFTGVSKSQPYLSLGFTFLLFSIAGVPPFVGFFAKQGVLEASLTAHYGGLAILAIVVSVITASYYLKVVRLMQFNTNTVSNQVEQPLTAIHTFLVAAIIIPVTFYMFLPSTFLDSTRTLALTFYIG